jgi:hypothetical protein
MLGDGGQIGWHGRKESKPLPAEWTLRTLLVADLDDDNALGLLLEDYGTIAWPFFDRTCIPRDRWELLAPLPEGDDYHHFNWWEGRHDATLEDARWWLKTARALTRVWTETSAGRDPTSAWTAEGFASPLADERTCWTQFAIALNIGLRPFYPHVERRVVGREGFEFTYGAQIVGLFSAACCQIYNFIVEEVPARRCENETCGRDFARQLGGTVYDQHRTKGPLRFCTPKCAHAEHQRQYRRRKAAQKKEQTP